jgi:class 3 adenylate cyclase
MELEPIPSPVKGNEALGPAEETPENPQDVAQQPLDRFDRVPLLMFYRDNRMELAYLVSSFRGHFSSTVVAILGSIAYFIVGVQQGAFEPDATWVLQALLATSAIMLVLGLVTLCIELFVKGEPGIPEDKERGSGYSAKKHTQRGDEVAPPSDERAEVGNDGADPQPTLHTNPRTHPLDQYSPTEVRKTRILESFAYVTYAVTCLGVIFLRHSLCLRIDSAPLRPTIAWAGCTKGIYSWTVGYQAYSTLFVDLPSSAFALIIVIIIPLLQFLGQYLINVDDQLTVHGSAVAVRVLVAVFLTVSCIGLLYTREHSRRHRFEVYVQLTERRMELLQRRRQVDGLMELLMPQSVVKKLLRKEAAMDVGHRCLVLVTQVHDFMSWSYSMLPALVVQAIDVVYSEFDLRVSTDFGLTKVKAIGESYICVSGLGHPAEEMHRDDAQSNSPGNVSLTGPAAKSGNTEQSSSGSTPLAEIRALSTTNQEKQNGGGRPDVASIIRFALFQLRTAQNVRNSSVGKGASPLSNLGFKAGLACSRCVGFLAVSGRSVWYEVAGSAMEVALAVAGTAPRDTLLITPSVRALCEEELSACTTAPPTQPLSFLCRLRFQAESPAFF